jgi:ABC-type multidrug transport system ATPase subunit
MLPMVLSEVQRHLRRVLAMDLLRLVGLDDRATHLPEQMSGGEQQRVAIAVALANDPSVLLADEPTGELDSGTSEEVFEVFQAANREKGVTIVVVTHDPFVEGNVTRTVTIRDGRTSTETLRRAGYDRDGEDSMVATEYVILDRAGRLQLPAHFVEELELERRVRMTLETDHAQVWPDRDLTLSDLETGEEER